ncbi:peptide-methionine (R)-S-oxide reductase MsrB [Microbulbifer sp. OS29]|uniref:peptide-methionine (R)-S-oxide reductase n=1 Tax=Microbulbifer okhotskensis TaxID=2926617 RepID=A0A9X2EQJ1_9GAMM|nr:peptide-methionine (R)-S-oxide reductase MsrB [Microbulbifer okhotskensis]MCO1333786.1 peptide-methionine (R)-S-oxide reductase MsrB [Microbulbifer okhotskensis]
MDRSPILVPLLVAVFTLSACSEADDDQRIQSMTVAEAEHRIEKGAGLEQIPKSVWKKILPEDRYKILWKKDTERAFSGKLLYNKEKGVYVTAGCRLPVFSSEQKYKSGTGWPSFWDVAYPQNIVLRDDYSWGLKRTEVLSKCGEHLGHLFKDGPEPTKLRYCLNSLSLDFIPAKRKKAP